MTGSVRRPEGGAVLTVTFQYYRDLPAAMAFYEHVMGFTLAIDQGWSKIYLVDGRSHIGLVDEARGMQNWAEAKTSQFCMRVSDVDEWYAWICHEGPEGLSALRENEELGIRAFTFLDPEGYQIEIQTAKPGH